MFVFASLEELVFSHLKGRGLQFATIGAAVLILAWVIYPTQNLVRFISDSHEQGVTIYNTNNTRKLDRSGLVVMLKKNPLPEGVPIYTNEPEAVYFLLHRTARMSPYDPQNYTADIQKLGALYAGWPPDEQAYLI